MISPKDLSNTLRQLVISKRAAMQQLRNCSKRRFSTGYSIIQENGREENWNRGGLRRLLFGKAQGKHGRGIGGGNGAFQHEAGRTGAGVADGPGVCHAGPGLVQCEALLGEVGLGYGHELLRVRGLAPGVGALGLRVANGHWFGRGACLVAGAAGGGQRAQAAEQPSGGSGGV